MQNRTREIALRRADRTALRGSCGGRPHNEHAAQTGAKKPPQKFCGGFVQNGNAPSIS